MKNLNTKTMMALGLTGAMSMGTASANLPEIGTQPLNSILEATSPRLSVNVSDGIATLFGDAESGAEAAMVEERVADIEGVDHVINLITWN
jgi:hypothetical protein